VQFAAPIICGFGVGEFPAPNGVVDRVSGKVSVHQFLHGAWLLAEVLKLGHDDHQAASRTAKPTPMAMAVKTSRIFSVMVYFQVKGAVAPWVGLGFGFFSKKAFGFGALIDVSIRAVSWIDFKPT
jgi:hypothetical protein